MAPPRETWLDKAHGRGNIINVAGRELNAEPTGENGQLHPTRGKKLKAYLKMCLQDAAAAQKAHDDAMAKLQSAENPITLRHTKAIIAYLEMTISEWALATGRNIAPVQYWHYDIVKEFASKCVVAYANSAQGTRGREHIKADTLRSFTNRLMSIIAHQTVDADGNKVGMALLGAGGLFVQLRDLVFTLTIELDLERHMDEKVVFGPMELMLMIQVALTDSEKGGTRLAAIQNILVCLFFFLTGARPSTLGPADEAYRQRGWFMKLKDVTIERLDKLAFKSFLHAVAFKGFNTTVGTDRTYNVGSTKTWPNLPLDFNTYLVVYLYLRDALEDVTSLEDLFDDNRSELRIKKDKLSEPLFCEIKKGGKGINVEKALMAAAAGSIFKRMSVAAGLEGGKAYSCRRYLGNVFSLIYGKVMAEMMLTHETDGNLHHYETQITNIDLTAIMTGERTEDITPQARMGLDEQKMRAPAVSAILMAIHSDLPRRLLQKNNAATLSTPNQTDSGASAAVKATKIAMEVTEKPGRGGSDANTLTKVEKEALDDTNPAVQVAKKALADEIEAVKAMVTGYTGEGLGNDLRGLARYIKKSRVKPGFTQGDVTAGLERARYLGEELTKIRRELRRNAKKGKAKEKLEAGRSIMQHPGTMQERQAVRNALETSGETLSASIIKAGQQRFKPTSASTSASASTSSASASASTTASASASTTASASASTSSVSAPTSSVSAPTSSVSAPTSSVSAPTSSVSAPTSASMSASNLNADNLSRTEVDDILEACDDGGHGDKLQAPTNIGLISRLAKESGTVPENSEVDTSDIAYCEASDLVQEGNITLVPPIDGNTPACSGDDMVDLVDARIAMIKYLVAPIAFDRHIDSACLNSAGEWVCDTCSLYTHDGKKASQKFSSRENLVRHKRTQHTEYEDLELKAVKTTNEKTTFQCTRCPKSYDNMPALRQHFRRRCPDKEYFIRLHLEHNIQIHMYKPRNDASRLPVPPIVEKLNHFLRWEKVLYEMAAEHSDDDQDALKDVIERMKNIKVDPPSLDDERLLKEVAVLRNRLKQ